MKDKKKLIAIAALGAVLVGVGAFTMIGGSQPPPAPVVSKKASAKGPDAAKAAEQPEAPKNPTYAVALPQRDPFKDAMLPADPPKVAPTLPPPTKAAHPRNNAGQVRLPPLDPGGNLPGANMAGNIGLQPAGPDPLAFNYRVSGVIVGAKPAAVFTDSQGNQRLVSVGASLDGDSKVLAIDRGQVTVQYRGKTLRLTLGGTPNEK